MPNLDKTGPQGLGPQTGRGRGYCTGQGPGRGRGMYGRGVCRFWPSLKKTDKKQYLKDEQEALKRELESVKQELTELDK